MKIEDYDIWFKPCEKCGFDTGKVAERRLSRLIAGAKAMTEAEIIALSETDHTPGLHRAGTLANKAHVSIGEASHMLSRCAGLTQITPFRFAGQGYQEDLCDQ